MERIIMHIDVNNAFLSWTAIDLLNHGFKKDIRNCYAVIGGDESKRHGIVLAKSNPAKKRGVVTAETLYSARKKIPNLEVYPPNFHWYQHMSDSLFKLLSNYTPDIEVFSIDECFLDYTGVRKLHGDSIEFAYKIKDQIYKELGFTVNIGIGNNKLCAKMASDFKKPNMVHTLFSNEIESKMYPLPIEEMLWVGKSSSTKLKMLGINTIGDLANSDYNMLYRLFKNRTKVLIDNSKGIDDSPVISEVGESKGISNSYTLPKNIIHIEEAYPVLNNISDYLCGILRRQKRYAYVVAIIVKDSHFRSNTHQVKLINATNDSKEVYNASKKLLSEIWNDEPLRLVGIRLDNLTSSYIHQMSLFEDIEEKEQRSKIDDVLDDLKNKYGKDTINKASLFDKKSVKKYKE